MWPFNGKNKKNSETDENLRSVSQNVALLSDSVHKILQDQRSLRGLVNRKMGNRMKGEKFDDEEDDSEIDDMLDPMMAKFLIVNGVDYKKNRQTLTPDAIAFIKETYDYKNWLEGQQTQGS